MCLVGRAVNWWTENRFFVDLKCLVFNRNWRLGYLFVGNSVTLDDLERRNSPNGSVISPNSVEFGADYVKVVEDTPILSAAEI